MNTKDYHQFLASKRITDAATGIQTVPELNPMLFDFQHDIVEWALRRGRAAIFADCGMGKTPMQLEWCKHVPGRTIIVAPLAVSMQTQREASKFHIDGIKYLREDDGVTPIVITNYEMLERFNPGDFHGIVLDESSILKSYTGKFRTYIIDQWGIVPFRLAATATPAPNDFMELGNHSEFLGTMTRSEMLSHFFVHDGGETQSWRLKGHAESEFWRWMCSWAVMIRKPSDLGYDDREFILPSYTIHEQVVDCAKPIDGMLFALNAHTMDERRNARRTSVEERVALASSLANNSYDPWVMWCDLNSESEMLRKSIPDAVEVKGSDDIETKESRLMGFTTGKHRVIVTKPSIAGFGLNWQHCSNMTFTGLSDSYEQFYQAFRRCWRFGQKNHVNAHIVTSSTEGAVVANIKRKEADSERMAKMMVEHMQDISSNEIRGSSRMSKSYSASKRIQLPSFLTKQQPKQSTTKAA